MVSQTVQNSTSDTLKNKKTKQKKTIPLSKWILQPVPVGSMLVDF